MEDINVFMLLIIVILTVVVVVLFTKPKKDKCNKTYGCFANQQITSCKGKLKKCADATKQKQCKKIGCAWDAEAVKCAEKTEQPRTQCTDPDSQTNSELCDVNYGCKPNCNPVEKSKELFTNRCSIKM